MKWFIRGFSTVIILTLCLGVWRYSEYVNSVINTYYDEQKKVILYLNDSSITALSAMLERDGHSFINVDLIEQSLPKSISFDASGKRLLIPLNQLKRQNLDAKLVSLVSHDNFQVNLPILNFADNNYIDIEYLALISDLACVSKQRPYQFYSAAFGCRYSFVERPTALKIAPRFFATELRELQAAEKVFIVDQTVQFVKVRTTRGETGYVARSDIENLYDVTQSPIKRDGKFNKRPYGRLQWTFDYFSDYNAVVKGYPRQKIGGLDALIATFFKLSADGWVINNGDFNYVNSAHQLGYSVYAQLDNQFDKQLTHQILSDPKMRKRVIDQLYFYLTLYQIDGVNLNLLNVADEDRLDLVTFVKELNNKLQGESLTVSFNLLPHDSAEHWSQYADNKVIARHCDYIVLMTYDEHAANSNTAGSVASLPWTEQCISTTLLEVPYAKLVLGVPTYTRVWHEKDHVIMASPRSYLSSKALAMKALPDFLEQQVYYRTFDEKTGQNYYEMENKTGETLKIWAEDAQSVKARLALIKKYDLAGVISWRKGFETEDFWGIIKSHLDK